MGGSAFRNWLPEPGSVRGTDHYQFNYLDTKTVVNNESEFDEERFEAITRMARRYREPIDVDFDETSWILTFQGMAVADANFDNEAEDLDASKNGRTVLVSGSIDTDELGPAVMAGSTVA